MRSGTSDIIPSLLKYPKFLTLEEAPSIGNTLCYVTKYYGESGISVLIRRCPEKDEVVVVFGDWFGNKLDLHGEQATEHYKIIDNFIANQLNKIMTLMTYVKLSQAQLFFGIENSQLVLVDIQLSINKLAGPGMVRDLFGQICQTQEVRKIEVLDATSLRAIEQGTGSYSGSLVIKPSVFKMHHDQAANSYQPLYVKISR
jgi:hypothetical protein